MEFFVSLFLFVNVVLCNGIGRLTKISCLLVTSEMGRFWLQNASFFITEGLSLCVSA